MANISSTLLFRTMWNFDRDCDQIERLVKNCVTVKARTVVFIGENHHVRYDVNRRHALMKAHAEKANVLMVVERGMISGAPAINMVVESNAAKSADDSRNAQVVGLLEERFQADRPLVIIFFFGQEHERPIKEHIITMLSDTVSLRWVSIKPILDYVEDEGINLAAKFDTKGKIPVGYIENDPANPDPQLLLLAKGWVGDPFNLEVSSAEQSQWMMTSTVYALYYADADVAKKKRTVVLADQTAYVKIKRIDSGLLINLKVIPRKEVAKAEAGLI